MQRLAYLACCTTLALGLAAPAFAGPLGSAASDAFRRLPQNSTQPPANPGGMPTGQDASASPVAAAAPGAPVPANPITPSSELPDPLASGSTYGVVAEFARSPEGSGSYITGGPGGQRVPEPGMLWLLGVGGVGLALTLARRRQK